MPDLIRHPELAENASFRVALRLHGMTQAIAVQSRRRESRKFLIAHKYKIPVLIGIKIMDIF